MDLTGLPIVQYRKRMGVTQKELIYWIFVFASLKKNTVTSVVCGHIWPYVGAGIRYHNLHSCSPT